MIKAMAKIMQTNPYRHGCIFFVCVLPYLVLMGKNYETDTRRQRCRVHTFTPRFSTETLELERSFSITSPLTGTMTSNVLLVCSPPPCLYATSQDAWTANELYSVDGFALSPALLRIADAKWTSLRQFWTLPIGSGRAVAQRTTWRRHGMTRGYITYVDCRSAESTVLTFGATKR